ncbi:MAG: hypothetical protein IJ471_01080, partial [Eubacterium sp.]|nr:hypothetical protein [Eubacterium sp.]
MAGYNNSLKKSGSTWTADDVTKWIDEQEKTANAGSKISQNVNSGQASLKKYGITWTADDVTKYTNQLAEKANASVQIPKLEARETSEHPFDVDKLLADDYKMTKEERKEVRKYTDEWLDDYGKRIRNGEFSQEELAKQHSGTDSEYYKMQQLYNKSDPFTSFVAGIVSEIPFVKGLANKAGEDNINAKQVLNLTKDAKTQNPIASGAGGMAWNLTEYAALKPVLQAIPGLSNATGKVADFLSNKIPGLGSVAPQIQNVLNDLTVDVALDTIPSLAEDIASDKSAGEVAGNAALNVGTNLGLNVLGEAAPALIKGVKNKLQSLIDVGAVKEAGESTIKQGVNAGTASSSALDAITDTIPMLDGKAVINSTEQATEGVSEQVAKKITDPVEKAFSSPDVYKTHSIDEIAKMQEYLEASDERIINFAKEVRKAGKGNFAKQLELNPVSDRAAQDIKKATGIDASGNKVVLDKGTIEHIDIRHGVQGRADHSMADDKTLSRIQYVLDNYDEAFIGKGTTKTRLKDQSPAPTVVFTKRVDGHYYVVEAATDAKTKKNIIVSAYIGDDGSIAENIKKGSIVRMSNATEKQFLPRTSETESASYASDNSIHKVSEN